MDESRYLQERYTKYHEQGLEVIGLAFERKRDQNISFKAIDKMVEDLGITYPVVFAGSTKIEDREKALPHLNKIMSFPSSIYINKKGEVVKIHTGFAGQGTSEYDNFVKETDGLIETLLSE
jgi:thiol-disulfide isomerase/thioredoxin